ncbi:MAG: FAD-dependent oxidoreductase [Patescibacteria group bacterium]
MDRLIISQLSCGEPKSLVVIGGGVTGALSAFELRRAGHRVTLLEARNWGNGSSSRSAACIRAQFENPSTIRGMVYCEQYYTQWTSIVGGDHSPITQNGYLFLRDWSANMEEIRRIVEIQREAGLSEVELLGRKELEDRFPYLESTGIQGATWCPKDGFLEPSVVYSGAVEAAKKLGAETIQNAEVVSVVFDDDRPIAVKAKDGREFGGEVFVNACGVWAPHISHLFGGYPIDVKARRRYLYFLEGFKDGGGDYMEQNDFNRLPMIITPRGCYFRPESARGSKLMMMGWLQPTRPVRPTFDNQDVIEPGFSNIGDGDYGVALRKEITTYLPDAEKMGKIITATTGFYEDTPDRNPLIGWDPWTPNLLHAAGFSGHGLMHAPFTAAAVVHLVTAGCSLDTIELPVVGRVDVRALAVDRVFSGSEGMVI